MPKAAAKRKPRAAKTSPILDAAKLVSGATPVTRSSPKSLDGLVQFVGDCLRAASRGQLDPKDAGAIAQLARVQLYILREGGGDVKMGKKADATASELEKRAADAMKRQLEFSEAEDAL